MIKPPRAIFKPLCISLLAALSMLAIWFSLAAQAQNAHTWFALVAALDIAVLERMLRKKDTKTALWIAPFCTALCGFFSLWLIAALSIHNVAGYSLLECVRFMGFGLFNALLQLRFSNCDWFLIGSAPIFSIFCAHFSWLNARHQST